MNQIWKKIKRFQGIRGAVRKHLKKTRRDKQMKFYKVVARPSLLYGSETWVKFKYEYINFTTMCSYLENCTLVILDHSLVSV